MLRTKYYAKLQKSNDTFGESELNTVLMGLLGNDPSGNALTPTPLAPPSAASLGTLPLGTATPTPVPLPTAPAPVPTVAPTPVPVPAPAPITTPITAPITVPITAPVPTPVPALTITILPTGVAPPPAPSPVIVAATQLGSGLGTSLINMASGFFTPVAPTPVAPPPPPVLPVTNLGAAFTSVATIQPNPVDLARQFVATQTLINFDTAGLQQVINTRGAPLQPTTDPLEMEISAGNQLLARIRVTKIDPKDLTGNVKINYDRAIELRKQVAASKAATKLRKEAALATKAEKEIRRDSSLSQAATSAGSPNPETKAQKQARIKAEKKASISGSI